MQNRLAQGDQVQLKVEFDSHKEFKEGMFTEEQLIIWKDKTE